MGECGHILRIASDASPGIRVRLTLGSVLTDTDAAGRPVDRLVSMMVWRRGLEAVLLLAALASLVPVVLNVREDTASSSTTRPNPQAQVAPPTPGPPISSDDHARDAHAPNPRAQTPPQPARQTADTEL